MAGGEDTGGLSQELRGLIERLAGDVSALVEETTAAIRGEVPEYARAKDPILLDEVMANIRENAEVWYRSVLEGRPPTQEELERTAEYARHRVHQGVPLSALLHAFRLGSIVFWRALLDVARAEPSVQSEVLFRLSIALMIHVDLVSQTIAQAYVQEMADRVRRRDRIKQELCELVLGETVDEEAFGRRAAALGLDPVGPYCALAIRTAQPPGDSAATDIALGLPVGAVATAMGVSPDTVVNAVRNDRLMLWVPVPAADPAWSGETLVAAAEALLEGPAAIELVGVGMPGRGADGWRTTAQQAVRALEIGPLVDVGGRVHSYPDLALYDLAARTPEVAGFLRVLLDRLANDVPLLDSLDAYFAHGRHVKPAAAGLHVHPNTLAYRLRRAEEMLGGRLDDSDWSLRLQLALKLRHYGGAPRSA